MKSIADLLNEQNVISRRQHGLQRAMHSPIFDLRQAIATAEGNPGYLDAWAHVILAACECGLRAGVTPFALAQAIVETQAQLGARRAMPDLARFKDPHKVDNQAPASAGGADAFTQQLDSEYGPVAK